MTTEKRREKAQKILSSMMGRDVPVISQSRYKISLIEALNYHNTFTDPKDLRRAVVSYLKENDLSDYLPAIDSSSDHELRQLGVLVMHKARGDYLADKELLFIENKLNSIKQAYKAPVVVIQKQKETKVVDRVLDQARSFASVIDGEIDSIFTKTSKGDFSIESFLKSNNVTESVCKRIASFYEGQIKELNDFLSGDEELKEAYSITKPHAKRILAFLNGVVDACLQNAASIKAQKVRKPRAKKKKPPHVLVAKLQYMKEFKELNLKSIDPKEIIGAKQLWIYNTKYKKLTRLVADNSDGLTIKGTTIVGIHLTESESKRVRKPEMVLADINKKNLIFHMKKMKTKDCEVNGRINKDTILLAV